MQLRQVQAHPLPRHGLRQVRRRSDAEQGAARAARTYRAGRAHRPYLVLQGPAQPHRPAAVDEGEGSRADPLLRVERRHQSGQHRAADRRRAQRRGMVGAQGRAPGLELHAGDGRRRRPQAAGRAEPRGAEPPAARRGQDRDLGAAQEGDAQAAEDHRRLHPEREQARVDDPGLPAGAAAGPAPPGAPGRRPVRDQRPQ